MQETEELRALLITTLNQNRCCALLTVCTHTRNLALFIVWSRYCLFSPSYIKRMAKLIFSEYRSQPPVGVRSRVWTLTVTLGVSQSAPVIRALSRESVILRAVSIANSFQFTGAFAPKIIPQCTAKTREHRCLLCSIRGNDITFCEASQL